ncbi:MAG: hypothetical protein VKK97_12910, partial [Synechococcaceae cyanobacterium]|nr:hypothetical protein [Synechococcaceae cyanobacterium]
MTGLFKRGPLNPSCCATQSQLAACLAEEIPINWMVELERLPPSPAAGSDSSRLVRAGFPPGRLPWLDGSISAQFDAHGDAVVSRCLDDSRVQILQIIISFSPADGWSILAVNGVVA